ncbi:scarecrow-like protein 14 [Salvia hispanica]|uniref:scarecrow-like protein 14 n=1 Tax=Salvia hispanica TaxID=49212 RepID=UPI00200906E8|nr:scarecrow-like protein 14 [Salvia hispanica]
MDEFNSKFVRSLAKLYKSSLNGEENRFSFSTHFTFLDIPLLPISPAPDNFGPTSNVSYETDSPDDVDSDPMLKFLNQILIEEDMEERPSMFHDPLALRAAEKSLYEVIGQKYPPSPSYPGSSDSPDSFYGNSSEYTSSSNAGSNSIDPQWIVDSAENTSSMEQGHRQDLLPDSFLPVSSQSSSHAVNSAYGNGNTQTNSFGNASLLQNFFGDSESVLQFKRGMEEASKFLPTSNSLIIDLDKYELPKKSEDISPAAVIKTETEETHYSSNSLKGRKHRHPDDGNLEDMERSSKQLATNVEEVELSEMFDRVLLCTNVKGCNDITEPENPAPLPVVLPKESNGRKARAQKNEKQDSVDLRSLLISCAQSVAADDRRTAYEQLKQIMQHSSPIGDVYQRLAHVFASGLQARLGGTGTELYASLNRRKITAAEKLKAYQWPILIQHLSDRASGTFKLRITGIELPQPGFRPAELLEETGSRLAKYCERFGVPFEYQAIATQNWEDIKIEDLNITSGEVIAVNSLFRFGRLLDETVITDSPRDAVLNLVRKIKPHIFVNTVSNGSYNAPFFVTRFREALFYYSALFDMFDATLPRDNPHRMDFEQDFCGREIINIVACEGAERVERPETYKQWQVRHKRAGFKPLPLDHGILKKVRHKCAGYHKDFLFDEDGCWILQGWKGRILCASSCWKLLVMEIARRCIAIFPQYRLKGQPTHPLKIALSLRLCKIWRQSCDMCSGGWSLTQQKIAFGVNYQL